MEKLLEVKNLCVNFGTYGGEVKAVRGVTFDLHKGETLAIVGESGSGKSVACKTIMRILSSNGYIKDGQILFDGKDLTKISEKDMEKVRGKDIAMIFQDPMTSLNPTMTIGKQIMEPIIKHQGFSKEDARKRAIELIELVGISDAEKRFKQYPHQFSGGMRQRIVIAISLACNPKVLIADEPTTALDVTIQAQILELIKDLQEKTGVAVIFITHDLGVVANMADRVAVMYAGKIIEYGTSDDIFYDPKHPYTWGLLGSMPTLDIGDNDLYNIPGTPPDLMDPPKGDAFALRSAYAMKIDHLAEPPMFKVSDTHYAATWLLHPLAPKIERPVNVGRKSVVKAVDDVSFHIYEGETFGLVGESGSGKSTTGRTIIRLYDPTGGEVIFDDKVISNKKLPKDDKVYVNKHMQMIFQDPMACLNPRMTVMDIIAEGLDIHGLCKSKEERTQRVYELLRTVGLNEQHANRYPHEFSGGQRQRIGIARALAVEPKFIIADEPISALDVSIQAQVVNLLRKLQKENGLTYLFIAHDLSMVKYISDRIGVMHKGKLVELASSDDLYENPLHPYTKSLLSAIPLPDPDYEKTRERIKYDPSIHDYSTESPEWVEIRPGHFIYGSKSELANYEKELSAKESNA